MPQGRGNFKVSESEGQVVRAFGGIAPATLLSRLLGFVRDMIVARAFGAGPVTDAFFVAFRIPNILRRLLAEGSTPRPGSGPTSTGCFAPCSVWPSSR